MTVLPVRTDFADLHHPEWHAPLRGHDWLFVGRLVPSKCQVELVEAFARFARRHPLARLVLVGDMSDSGLRRRDRRPSRRRWGSSTACASPGKLTDAELVRHFHRAGLYVSLSEHEGFGVPLLEAMAAELPVLAYRAGAVAETMAGPASCSTTRTPTASPRWPASSSPTRTCASGSSPASSGGSARSRPPTSRPPCGRSSTRPAPASARSACRSRGRSRPATAWPSLNRHLAVELARQPRPRRVDLRHRGPGRLHPRSGRPARASGGGGAVREVGGGPGSRCRHPPDVPATGRTTRPAA